MNSKFTWISLYNELSEWLLLQRDNQPELISILKDIGITGFRDGYERGEDIELVEIDPFTFFSYLNKFHSDAARRTSCRSADCKSSGTKARRCAVFTF